MGGRSSEGQTEVRRPAGRWRQTPRQVQPRQRSRQTWRRGETTPKAHRDQEEGLRRGEGGSVREARGAAKPLASVKHLAGCPETVRLGGSGGAHWRGEVEEKGPQRARLSAGEQSALQATALC